MTADNQAGGTAADALALEFKSTEMVGSDLRIVARVAGRGVF